MVRCVADALGPGDSAEVVSAIHEAGWATFLEKSATPIPNFSPDAFRAREYENELRPVELEDVKREAIGPPRHPGICSTYVDSVDVDEHADCAICGEGLGERDESVMRVRCPAGHMFHFGCLKVLVNGIEEYCNKCPVCRWEICRGRGSRAVVG